MLQKLIQFNKQNVVTVFRVLRDGEKGDGGSDKYLYISNILSSLCIIVTSLAELLLLQLYNQSAYIR